MHPDDTEQPDGTDWSHRILEAQHQNAHPLEIPGPLEIKGTGWTAVPLESVHVEAVIKDASPALVTYVAENLAYNVHMKLQNMVGTEAHLPEERLVPLLSDLLSAWDDVRRASAHLPPTELEERRSAILHQAARQIAPAAGLVGPTGPVGPVGPAGPPGAPPVALEEQPHTLLRRPTAEELNRAAGLEPQTVSVSQHRNPYNRALWCLEGAPPGTLPEAPALRRALLWFLSLAFEGGETPRWTDEAVTEAAQRWEQLVIAAHLATEDYAGPQLAHALNATGCPATLRTTLVQRFFHERDLLLAYDDEAGA